MRRFTFPIVLIVIVAAFIGIFVVTSHQNKNKPCDTCGLGLQATPAPWQPEYAHLANRVAPEGFPASGNESYHVHAHLSVYVNGQSVPIPAQIGLNGYSETPLHTHDATGLIHIEAGESYPFTLKQFLDVWGVKFTDSQLGSYQNTGQQKVWLYVNGKQINDIVGYQLKKHDNIVLAYGKAGSFPTTVPFDFPQGL